MASDLRLLDAILTLFETLKDKDSPVSRFLPFAVEASWITGKWDSLGNYLNLCAKQEASDFNVGIGSALYALRQSKDSTDRAIAEKSQSFMEIVNDLRLTIAKSLTVNSVGSLQSCHDDMLRLHALADMEAIADAGTGNPSYTDLPSALNRRLDVLGGYIADKQYLLGLRRAAMELSYVEDSIVAVFLANLFQGWFQRLGYINYVAH